MAARKRPKVVLCATLTADGKLDVEVPAVPLVLYSGSVDPARHPWGALYDEAAGVLVDRAVAAGLPMPPAAVRTVVAVNVERAGEAEIRRGIGGGLERLEKEGATRRWLCFGGARLFRVLLEAGWVDELSLCVRPRIDGRRGAATLSGVGGEFFSASVACRLVKMEVAGDECFLRYRVVKRAKAGRKAA